MSINLIWDLDGTLLDSYDNMVESLLLLCNKFNIDIAKIELLKKIKTTSITDFIKEISVEKNLDYNELINLFIKNKRTFEYNKLIENVFEVLVYLKEKNIKCYVYTHNDNKTFEILKKLNVIQYFEEIITSDNGFLRKPNPDALIYLIEKYKMEKENTYYIGDRNLDIECANNAKIKSILFLNDSIIESEKKETYLIKDMLEIKEIFR